MDNSPKICYTIPNLNFRRITMENQIICNCMKVSVADIEKALHEGQQFADVEKQFEKVQMITHCSTGCGGCHDKVLDTISHLMN